jgi:hypothetical protein
MLKESMPRILNSSCSVNYVRRFIVLVQTWYSHELKANSWWYSLLIIFWSPYFCQMFPRNFQFYKLTKFYSAIVLEATGYKRSFKNVYNML